jgi:hypothetical protein
VVWEGWRREASPYPDQWYGIRTDAANEELTERVRYQLFGRNYQDRGRPRAHLKSIAKGNLVRPTKKDAVLQVYPYRHRFDRSRPAHRL